ncbi:hypothetical protein [Hymenobacter defluvii]|uniref:Uncharacterized protein n=1 Tax=Hymenobacter defluvii TaxID=2054411 RepID=A0ABS3TI96_9BACT|nr:hypothetical protein [Hymenobacter defluvii]MBO3273348.1 hypothetical protein [Hymenobacter defluvii]
MPKALRLTISFLVCCLAYTTVSAQKLSSVKAELASPFFENLYANTYYSLVDRMDQDGYLPESLTGAYDGMFCRTVGAIVPLFLETGRLQQAERTINCALTAMQQNEMDRIPHVIGKKGDKYPIISDEPQIDGQEHVLMAWAMLALKRGHTAFEDRTWPVVRDLTKRTFDRTSFQHGQWSTEPGLVRNIAFEHSHEGRRWDTWDLLTQSFAGATLQDMAAVADRRGETQLADDWRTKLQILRKGIRKKMTTVRGQDTTYLEMRLPDGNGGQPYLGMGWVALSPIAAQWEALDHRVLQHTVKAMQ